MIHKQNTHCEVCQEPLPRNFMSGQAPSICKDIQCQQLYQQRFSMAPGLYQHHFQFQQSQIRNRKAEEKAKKNHIAAIERYEAEHNQAILKQALASDQSLSADKIHLVAIPTSNPVVVTLSHERRQNYKAHLEQVFAEARSYQCAGDVPVDQHHTSRERLIKQDAFLAEKPRISDASDQLCILCKGGCCAEGHDHAYISAITIRRMMDDDPSLDLDALMDSFLSRLADKTIEDSCINQTPSGCVLPRELRSDVCNVYLCDSVKNLQKSAEQDERVLDYPALVVQRSNNNWNRFSAEKFNPVQRIMLIKSDGITELDPDLMDQPLEPST